MQVNNSQSDWRRTGSVYAYDDVREVYMADDEWYTQHIIVRGNTVTVKLNDKTSWNTWSPKTWNGQPARRQNDLQRHVCFAGARSG